MTKQAGTLVIAPIRTYDDQDTFPSAVANEIQGGHHQVATLTARDAIPAGRRAIGMICWVSETATDYRLVGGIENDNWVEVVGGTDPGGGTGGSFSATVSGLCLPGDAVGNCVYVTAPIVSGLYQVTTADPTDIQKIAIGMIVSKESSTSCIIQFLGEVEGVYAGLTVGGLWLDLDGTVTTDIPATPPGGVFLQKVGNAVSSTRLILAPERPSFRRLP